jgi:hypothetical protein
MLAMALPIMAQDKDSKDATKADKVLAFYKLDLAVREMDGSKVVNTRNYTINQKGDDWGRFRVGSRIPVSTGVVSTATSNANSVTQWQYIDVGLNADCHVIESDPGPTLVWTIELSSVAPEPGAGGQPVIRNVRSQGQTLLTFNKPVVLSNTDDLSSTHKFVFEVTATKIK